MTLLRQTFAGAAVAAMLVLAPSAKTATSCSATVHATPRTDQAFDDYTVKAWAVDIEAQVDSSIDCAKVYVDFTVTERLFDGEEITQTIRGFRKTAGSHASYKVEHRIAKDSTLKDSSFKVVRCVVCGTE